MKKTQLLQKVLFNIFSSFKLFLFRWWKYIKNILKIYLKKYINYKLLKKSI
ncbi:MAG: hypothetical protein MR481_05970 [Campylobacter sp.]|uniref:hypothetical protein n=1 Tax=Campylobacter sp. TaxID=205 RepID=UPI002AA7FEC0|nr:hypothetical protein [Campylobacter sp.]MCI7247452.1 hypothetical protein [Campylobacter sp.]